MYATSHNYIISRQADGNDVLIFYEWLHGHHPELLPKTKRGDPYQYLKVDRD